MISWEDFYEKHFTEPQWLIQPYVPRDGIVFLWGETSTGKSPLGWHIAAAVGRGDNFFGLPAWRGKVLYLEVDTPQRLVHERILSLPPAKGVDFLFLPPLSVPEPAPEDMALLQEAAQSTYDLVIVNTLRKVHDLNDKEPQTPKVVYSFFQHLFPGTALIFVHHTKKTQVNPDGSAGRAKESFSGAMNWLNDAQVGLHLSSYLSDNEGVNVRLNHEKSQVSQLYGPLGLWLNPENGAEMRCPRSEELAYIYELMNESELKGKELDALIAEKLSCSPTTAWRRRQVIEGGLFPGVEWLGRKGKEGGS